MTYPTIKILPGQDRRMRTGSPWLFSNELRMDADAKAIAPGSLVRVMAPSGKMLGVAQFNPHSLIAARMLTRNKDAEIGRSFVSRRLARALQLRERLFETPHYRLIHAEADGLPGLVVDRFGDTLVVQINTAGMAGARGPDRRGAGRGPPAAHDRRPQRFPVAPARRAGERGQGAQGRARRPGSSWSRTA